MRILIDTGRCQGHGRCTLVAPDLFDLDDDGKVFLLLDEVPRSQVELADRAVANCPEQALAVGQGPPGPQLAPTGP